MKYKSVEKQKFIESLELKRILVDFCKNEKIIK